MIMPRCIRSLLFVLAATMMFAACNDTQEPNPVNPLLDDSPAALSKLSSNYLVEYTGKLSNLEADVKALGGSIVNVLEPVRIAVVTGITEAQAQSLQSQNNVQDVVRDMKIQWVPSFGVRTAVYPGSVAPTNGVNSPADAALYSIQWNMHRINAAQAWAVTEGEGVRVGILDTGGSPDHIDLYGKYDQNACINFTSSDPTDWQDRHFHGTHVAGTISTNNIGVAGLAPDATLIAVKVLGDDGWGDWAWLMQGIMYAADPNGGNCDIINMSLSGSGPKAQSGRFIGMMNKVVNWANSQGCLVVCAAANDAVDLDHNQNWIVIPAECGAAMAISATGPVDQVDFDQPACYTNYGTSVINVAAPGGNVDCTLGWVNYYDGVLSTLAPAVVGGATDAYAWAAGTSMASPHVAGTAALIEAAKGNSTPGFLRSRLQNTATDLGAPGADPYYGKGFINAAAAVQ